MEMQNSMDAVSAEAMERRAKIAQVL